MKKGIRIFVSIIGFMFISLGIWIEVFDNDTHNYYMDGNTISILQGIGKLLLHLVRFVFSFFSLLLIFLIPMMIYRFYRESENDFEFNKKWGRFILIVLAGISIVSIAGVQLRKLEQFPLFASNEYDAKVVRVVPPSQIQVVEEQSSGKSKDLEDHFYYYNDSIRDWVLTSKIDYLRKKEKPSHLTYKVKSETKKYRKSTLGNWLEVNRMGFNAAKSGGVQTLEYIPKPNINYFLFASNDWKKITKEEFFKYRELDSIVRYE
jgi:hypothetical protein